MILEFPKHRLYRKTIKCPLCKKEQVMALDMDTKIWYPYAPFCCNAMATLDTMEWNCLLDTALKEA